MSTFLYEKIIHGQGSTFSHKVYPRFTMPWHYHPEFELIVITSGGGKRFVGDYMDDFKVGDLVLYGANLPHFHMCYGLLNNNDELVSGCEVIQFNGDIFPEKMAQLGEMNVIADLLERSKRGVKFTAPPSVDRMCAMMRNIDRLSGVKRMFALMRILEILGKSKDYKLMTSGSYSNNLIGDDESDKVNKVYRFLTNNFKNEITLEQIADHVGFNPSALCRYFKKHAQKSIFQCLTEIRIGFACKLLTNSSLPVTQIAYESGYSNISNFNRRFREITNLSPTQYRELR